MTNSLPVSLIIPIYNIDQKLNNKYLIEIALDSVLNSKKIPNEIILINDASCDNTCEILQKITNKNNNIKVIHKEKNEGAYASRKVGIQAAKEDCIFFLDADDFLEKDALEICFDTLKKNDADACALDLVNIDYRNTQVHSILKNNKENICGKKALVSNLINFQIARVKLYKKNTVLNAIKLLESKATTTNYNIDEILAKFIYFCAKIISFSRAKYFYRKNESSFSRAKRPIKIYKPHNTTVLYKFALEQELFQNINQEGQLKRAILSNFKKIFHNKKFYTLALGEKKFYFLMRKVFYDKGLELNLKGLIKYKKATLIFYYLYILLRFKIARKNV